ncbi:hypothetical protein ARMSODRAFT_958523 [Armillaria solidipes]|uniref:Uncharacterized protein n=1 Tax=Armillaria solidipes TaxID=1076256 RepID=A0A2H3BY52_9AGAR|nr:hypothetical protein ARMSODRAFT_958523 [Armillaria solidipes]
MGQYWYIINTDTHEHLGCWGKLGEFFSTPDDYGALLEESWVGCRIMCIGDNSEDSPPDVLTLEELDEIKTLPGMDMICAGWS